MESTIHDSMEWLALWKNDRRSVVSPLRREIPCKLPFEIEYYREAVFYRFIDLIESAYSLYRLEKLQASIVVARSAQETFSVLWYLNERIKTLLRTKNVQKFVEKLDRLMHGWSGDHEFPEKIQIMDMVDSVDKAMEGKFRRHYDSLSEYAHPNWSGTLGSYVKPNRDELNVEFEKYARCKEGMKTRIEVTFTTSIGLLESVQITYSEVINQVIDLCYDLHEQGELIPNLKKT